MKVDFKVAQYEDIEDIIKLCNECFFEENNLEKAKEIFLKTKDDSNSIYLIGLLDGKIIAHTKISIIETMFVGMEKYAVLNHICVKAEYRRHKVGTLMLDEVTNICKICGCSSIKLWSNNYRHDAHACYNHYGFNLNDAGFFSKNIMEGV